MWSGRRDLNSRPLDRSVLEGQAPQAASRTADRFVINGRQGLGLRSAPTRSHCQRRLRTDLAQAPRRVLMATLTGKLEIQSGPLEVCLHAIAAGEEIAELEWREDVASSSRKYTAAQPLIDQRAPSSREIIDSELDAELPLGDLLRLIQPPALPRIGGARLYYQHKRPPCKAVTGCSFLSWLAPDPVRA